MLLDVCMPGLSGVGALSTIVAPALYAKVIMISGAANEDVLKRSLAFGAHDYVTKPFEISSLSRVLAATATVLYAYQFGLVPITTPADSLQSNGLAEAFVKTFKRDYVNGAELRDVEAVLVQLSGGLDDYNTRAPHSTLGMRSRPTTGPTRPKLFEVSSQNCPR